MPTPYHDDSNTPRYNFVPHIAAGDTQRGLPVVGKLVYRTDTSGLQVCTSTSPDPGQNGGGTWAAVAGPTWSASTVTMLGTGQPTWGTSNYTNRRWCQIGDFIHVTWYFTLSSGFNAGTYPYWWNFELPVSPNYYSIGAGGGFIYKPYVGYANVTAFMAQGTLGHAYVNLVVAPDDAIGTNGIVGEGTPWNWTEGSIGYFSLAYRTA